MPKITSIEGRILYNSRGSKTIEVDIITDNKFLGRVCAPSGASVGKYEAVSFPNENPEESLQILKNNSHAYIMTNTKNLEETLTQARLSGFHLHNLLVWVKNNCVINRWYMKNGKGE